MKRISIKLGKEMIKVNLPDNTEILSIIPPNLLGDPYLSIQRALECPIGSPSLDKIIEQNYRKTQKQRQ